MFRRALFLGLLLTAGGCSFYMGEPKLPKTDFRATLNGASEVPPADTKGTGYFAAVYRPSTRVLEYQLNVVGLSGPVTMAYLHGPAPAGENAQQVAPINVPFYADRSTIESETTISLSLDFSMRAMAGPDSTPCVT